MLGHFPGWGAAGRAPLMDFHKQDGEKALDFAASCIDVSQSAGHAVH